MEYSAVVVASLLLLASTANALEMRAYFSTGGVYGYISFTADSFTTPGSATTLRLRTTQLKGYPATGDILWHIHEYGYAPGATDVCGAASTGGPWDPDNRMAAANYSDACIKDAWHICALGDLSGKLGDLIAGGRDVFVDASSLRLIDLLGRSIVLHYASGERFACANFVYVDTPGDGSCDAQPYPTTYVARFVWPIAGHMMFRNYYPLSAAVNKAGSPVSLTAHLYDVTGWPSQFSGELGWTGHSNAISFNDTLVSSPALRCANVGPALVDGNFSDSLNITLKVGATPMHGRQILPYADASVAYGSSIKSIVLWKNSTPVACATLEAVHPVTARAWFGHNSPNYVWYSQHTPLDTPTRRTDISGVTDAGSVAVRSAPVKAPTLMSQSGVTAECAATSSLYNPSGVTSNGTWIGAGNMLNNSACDVARTLFGPNSILGRSATIESTGQPSTAHQCATLQQVLPSGTRSLLAKVSLATDGPINGEIYLWQAAYPDGTHSDTKLILQGLKGSSSTMNHNFHVHVNRVPPYPSSKNPCAAQYSSVHYNPFNVNSTAEAGYSAACNAHGQMRCELGDLSGKTGQLNIDGSNQLRTVHMLPLEGRQSIMGKSIVIHAANSGGDRIACGNVISPQSTDAYVTFVTPSAPFNANKFVALAQRQTTASLSTFQYVKAFSDPLTKCTTVSFNILANNLTQSMQLASDLKRTNLDEYTHQPKCDPTTDAASSLTFSLPLVLLSLLAAFLWQ